MAPRPKQSHEEHLALLEAIELVAFSSFKHPVLLTLESRFLNLFRRSESSGAVIRLLFRFWTMMLANSISCPFVSIECTNKREMG